jgi:SOS-response transcriptional repressor LexA
MNDVDAKRLHKIQERFQAEQVLPSYAGLARLCSMKSKAAAYKFVTRMEAAGYLRRTKSGRVGPGPHFFGIPVDSAVRAGFDDLGQRVEETIDLRSWLQPGGDTFLVRVEGESMMDAGIRPDDLILAQRRTPMRGDVVIAEIDGAFTLKVYDEDNIGPRLDAANAGVRSRRPTADLRICGVGVGLMRLGLGRVG